MFYIYKKKKNINHLCKTQNLSQKKKKKICPN